MEATTTPASSRQVRAIRNSARFTCYFRHSSSIHRAPADDAHGGRPRPLLSCYTKIYSQRFSRDRRLLSSQRAALCVRLSRETIRSRAEDVEEAVLYELDSDGDVPYPALHFVAAMLQTAIPRVTERATRVGVMPFWVDFRATILVREIIEEEEGDDPGRGEGTPEDGLEDRFVEHLLRLAMEMSAVDGQLDGDNGGSMGCGSVDDEEKEEGEGGEQKEEESCAICLQKMVDSGRERRWLPCSHSFHEACVGRWLRLKAQCPLCRLDLAGHQPADN